MTPAMLSETRTDLDDRVNSEGGSSRRTVLWWLIAAAVTQPAAAAWDPFSSSSEEEMPSFPIGPKRIAAVDKTIYTEGDLNTTLYSAVIPHSSEKAALKAARQECKGPITYVAGNTRRCLRIETEEGVISIDPNHVFCEQGVIRSYVMVSTETMGRVIARGARTCVACCAALCR